MNPIYEIVQYEKKVSEYSKEVSVEEMNVNFTVKTVEQAHTVAELAEFKSYGIVKLHPNAQGEYWQSSNKSNEHRIFVTVDVLDWEAQVKQQKANHLNRKNKIVESLNSLPKKVTLYKGDDLLITAERNDCEADQYTYSDIKYYSTILFKDEEFDCFRSFITEGYKRKGIVLRKKFAQEIYKRLHEKEYLHQSYHTRQETLKNISPDFVKKYGDILQTAIDKLTEHNNKIETIKGQR